MINLEGIINKLIKYKIITNENCWETKFASGNHGYTLIAFEGKQYTAHRISAAYYHKLNLKDKNKMALHKNECNNRKCWNPDHIYIGNASNNFGDRLDNGTYVNKNKIKTHCNRGHELKEDNVRLSRKGRECKKCAILMQQSRRLKNSVLHRLGSL